MKKIFGRKDKSDRGSPAPQDDNPYARQPAEDPYANSPAPSSNSFQPNRPMGLPSGPRPGGAGVGGLPRGPAPGRGFSGGPPPPYPGNNGPGPQPSARSPAPQQSAGYGNDKFGASGGYGGHRYDNGGAPFDNKQPRGPPQRQGGYGGLGSVDDDNRGGLFNDYKPPAGRQNPSWNSGSDGPSQTSQYGSGVDGYGGGGDGGYGGYGEERELTEEEQQEMQVQDVKKEIINTQKATIASGARSMQLVGTGAESAMNIAQALARQREHLDNAERNVDNACKCLMRC
jgi:protein transport protein SEC9